MTHEEAGGYGCMLWFVLPPLVFMLAYMAHCGWSSYRP